MVRDGVLAPTELPGRTAIGYELASEYQAALEELRRDARESGRLVADARVMEVTGPLDQLVIGLSDVSEQAGFGWAARLGPERFLVLLHGSLAEMDDAHIVLRRRGLNIELVENVWQVLRPVELREWAARLDRDRELDTVASEDEIAKEGGAGGRS
jgi:hypothetical protein